MPPPATAVIVSSYERSLRAILNQAQQAAKPAVRPGNPRASMRRSVEGKDFLQRLREAGL